MQEIRKKTAPGEPPIVFHIGPTPPWDFWCLVVSLRLLFKMLGLPPLDFLFASPSGFLICGCPFKDGSFLSWSCPSDFCFLGCISKYVFLDVWSPPSDFLYVCVFLKDGSLDPWCALVNVLCKVVSPRIGFEIVGIPFRISYARSYFKGLWVSYLWWYSKGWLLFLRMLL